MTIWLLGSQKLIVLPVENHIGYQKMIDLSRTIVNIISLAINIGLAYFAVRMMFVFKGGSMEKVWFPVITGSLCLAIGSSLFSMYYLLNLPSFVHSIGGVIAMIGGTLILTGLRGTYRSWTKAG